MGWFSKGKGAIGSTYEYFAAGVFFRKNRARGVFLHSLMFSTPFIYAGLISLVLFRPEIMAFLGLEPFVQYMMHEVQPGGYENIVQLSGPEFALYFFQFHAATLLTFGGLTIAMLIITGFVVRPSRMGLEDCIQAVECGKHKLTNFKMMWVFLFALSFGIYLYMLPFILDDNSRFSASNGGIRFSIVMWTAYICLFQGFVIAGYVLLLFRWWPKFKANRKK